MSTPSLGTAYIDGYKLGKYQNKNFDFGTIGLPISPRLRFRFSPHVQESIFGGTGGSVISGAGPLTLTASPPTITSASSSLYGNLFQFDFARPLFFSIISGTLSAPITFTISGLDFWGHPVVEQKTLSSGSTANSYSTKKTFRYIKSIYSSAGSGSVPISISTGTAFGFPYFIPHQTFVLASLDGVPDYCANITADTGTYFLIAPHTSMGTTIPEDMGAIVVGDTSTATATTGDPRGMYYPNPNNYPGADNAWITLDLFVPGFDCQAGQDISPNSLSPSQSYAYGVTQYSIGWQ